VQNRRICILGSSVQILVCIIWYWFLCGRILYKTLQDPRPADAQKTHHNGMESTKIPQLVSLIVMADNSDDDRSEVPGTLVQPCGLRLLTIAGDVQVRDGVMSSDQPTGWKSSFEDRDDTTNYRRNKGQEN